MSRRRLHAPEARATRDRASVHRGGAGGLVGGSHFDVRDRDRERGEALVHERAGVGVELSSF